MSIIYQLHSKFDYHVHNVDLETVILKLKQRFSNHLKLCEDFSFFDPRNFSEEISATALVKLTKHLGFKGS